MSDMLTIDKTGTAILIMDYQNDIVALLPEEQQKPLLQRTAKVLDVARKASLPVIYVGIRFRDGYPEISPRNKVFSSVKQRGLLLENTSGVDIRAEVAPEPGEIIVTKYRSSAFHATELETVLQVKGVNKLVLFGVRTSGCVLSTVRQAADMDYGITVISDCCADTDDETHRVLTQKIFPQQTTVVTAQEFISFIENESADKQ